MKMKCPHCKKSFSFDPGVLTGKEAEIYSFLVKFCHTKKQSPTLAEVGKSCGIRSTGTVHRYISSLQDKGFILINGGHRGIEII